MAKCTAVIDIGSNSMRLAVFQKTSRFAFHILHEVKSSVRISEHAYINGGHLQEEAMDRTAQAIGEFLSIARSFDARKILCVATSALRDAPNASAFLSRIQREHKLSIKVITGEKEAYFGAIACANLLPRMDALTVDVGGGSSEFAQLRNGKVETLFSLNIGTVRIKELFFDQNNIPGAIAYIDEALKQLPKFDTETLMGIGGTFRAITRALMKKEKYPLRKLHGFSTDENRFLGFTGQILEAGPKKLRSLYIKPDRFDTIKPGILILERIIRHTCTKQLVCSGVGVREGVYLSDLLRNSGDMFPANYNPSVRYLLDTYAIHSDHGLQCAHLSKRLFELLCIPLNIDPVYEKELVIASKLISIGVGVRYYAYQRHSHYLAMNALDYALSHSQIVLISHLLLFKKGHTSSSLIPKEGYGSLLPDNTTVDALSAILRLSHILLAGRVNASSVSASYEEGVLLLRGEHLYLAKEQLKNIILPKNLTVVFD
ncbi:MAG: Ppx/GppA phosphatase family protein [Sulfuricurvum sp.]|uniref:Ppx/GppA phosphatase family protein n=1 Tax=Sulfuricurvum sp. TaxID=2025608 RepID=UPI002630E357|nr:Ppx/GppA phosphatase family protein [Sulfuricurvum sp.]MDD2369448.1 Ppx/GppA phosphatase family protein [Sulfuricurvum sp.]MDD2949481.1 Ppx/GppA phosphatase family protein [Sulfuricurvum sp.]MDD5119633.1 Ppx/GppA phosphatase family protein [Sulfuricurvum sp.]